MDCLRPELDKRPATTHLRVVGACLSLVMAWLAAPAAAQDVPAQTGRPVAAVIDDYVREGLKSNLALQAQSLEVERSTAALAEARARYFPELALDARYTRAQGGRTIELPLGQALNPAYQTLNDLLIEHGMSPSQPDWLMMTPLHQIARNGNVEAAAALLDRGANLHARDEDICSTPLGWAAKFGQLEMVRFLIARGAQVNHPDDPPWARSLAWA